MTRRGWCPTVFAPMVCGDGLLARVKPRGSTLNASAARIVAEAAAAHGNGLIELTNRGNLQVRGLTDATAPRFAAAMVAARLAAPDAAAERRRTVILAPLADAEAAAVAAELEARLEAAEDLAALPPKFGFAVESGPLPLGPVRGDVRLAKIPSPVIPAQAGIQSLSPAERLDPGLRRGDEQGTWLVWRNGAVAAIACTAAGAAGVALHLAVASLASTPVDSAAIRPLPPAAPPPCVVGSLPGAWGVGLPFGATDATTLHALADLAERYGDGALRLTPWRAFIVRGGALPEAAAALGLIVDPADPRLALAACAGRPGCASAHADTRADAARLAALLPGLRAHLSGCTKGCAHPGPAPVTLVACPDGYALVRDGAASDTPEHTGLTLDAAAALVRRAPEPALP